MNLLLRVRERLAMMRAARAIRKDQWLHSMMVHVAELMNNPAKQTDHLIAEFLQTTANAAQREAISSFE